MGVCLNNLVDMKFNVFDSLECNVSPTDAAEQPMFVGRHEELTRLNNYFKVVSERKQGSAGIVLVNGISGIGKSQLIEKFARDKEQDGDASWLKLSVDNLSESKLLELLRNTLRYRQKRKRWTDIDVKAIALKSDTPKGEQCDDLAACFDQLASSKHGEPIILTIDDVQEINLEQQASTLRRLHSGLIGLPILVVCAGLQNAPAVLHEHGITRPGEKIKLETLSQADCVAAISQMLDVWGCVAEDIDRDNTDLKIRALASSTQGFPCHLQSHISALKVVIRERCGNFGTAEDWLRVGELSDYKRNEYYSGRIEALGFPNAGIVMHRIAKLLNQRMHASFKTVSSADIIKILNTVESEGMVEIDKGKALVRMIESGCLKVEEYSFYSIPIPSFQQYLMSRVDPYSKTVE